jgi:hypothetical protein
MDGWHRDCSVHHEDIAMNDDASIRPLSPSLRPLPRMSCRPGETLVRVPTNPSMPCAGVGEDETRRALRTPGAMWITAAIPIAFAAAAVVAALAS